MKRISLITNISNYKSLESLSNNEVFSCIIAELFASTFDNYKAYLYKDDKTGFCFPFVKLPSKTINVSCLPYSWPTFLRRPKDGSLSKAIKRAIKNLNADILQFSFHSRLDEDERNMLASQKFKEVEIISHVLNIGNQTFEHVFEHNFSTKTRNQCRKALKSDLNIQKSEDKSEISDFFRIYENTAKNWEGFIPYPYSFFEQLITDNANVELWRAKKEDKLIAGIIIIKFEDTVYYWSSALDRDYSKLCPVNGLLYYALKEYCGKEYSFFDFGPSPKGEGVSHFKNNFGTEELSYYNYVFQSNRYKFIIEPILKFLKRI